MPLSRSSYARLRLAARAGALADPEAGLMWKILRNAGLLGGFVAVYGLLTSYPRWKPQLGLQVSDPVLFIGLLAWGFCVGSAHEAARSKKRSAWEWMVVALFFGPLALLALAALGPEGTACSTCDTIYSRGAPRCPVCSYPAP